MLDIQGKCNYQNQLQQYFLKQHVICESSHHSTVHVMGIHRSHVIPMSNYEPKTTPPYCVTVIIMLSGHYSHNV
jgi:hypothetical protein